MTITKFELKALRRVYRKSSLPFKALRDLLDDEAMSFLFQNGYFSLGSVSYLAGIPDDAPISLSRLGLATVEESEWFDWSFLIRNIILPILIGVLSSVITNLLLRF